MSSMYVVGTLLVSLFGTLQASVLPEDFDEIVLLQRKITTRNQFAASILQQPLEFTQANMSEQLDVIEKFLQEQDPDDGSDSDGSDGSDSSGGGGSAGNGGGAAGGTDLSSVKRMLEEQMEAYLRTLHTAAQSDWSAAMGLYTTCGTHRERRFDGVTGDVVLAERAMQQARLKHTACRRSEQTWNVFRATSYSPPADLPVHYVSNNAAAFCQAMSNAQTQAQIYNDVAPVGKHDCLVDQTTFEWSICTWEAKAREACNAYTTCTAAAGLTNLRNRLRVDAAERRALWTTIGILKCRIDELSDGAAGTDAADSEYTDPCADMTVSTHHLVLDLPEPTPNDCSDEQLPPLTGPSIENSGQCAVWIGTEYGWEPSEAVVPVACAATCTGVHPPLPPSDCEDTDAQCDFYRLHPSACGSFSADGQAFQACNACCYCQFSPGCGNCPPGYRIHQGGTACQECPEGQVPNADSTDCVEPEPCLASVDCSNHGTTDDLDRSNGCVCSCSDGYSGVACSTPPPCDEAVHCSGHGATVDVDSTNGCVCACDDGFSGEDCSTSSSSSLPPRTPVFDGATTCTSAQPSRRTDVCPAPSAPPGWVVIAEYQDDECIRDIPDFPVISMSTNGQHVENIATWQEGWSTTNAAFMGQDSLHGLLLTGAYTKAAMCVKASRTQCTGGCFEFDTSSLMRLNLENSDICGEYVGATDLEKMVLFLAGACACRDGIQEFFAEAVHTSVDFTGPMGSDGRPLLACRRAEQSVRPGSRWGCEHGWSWHMRGFGVTLKNSNVSDDRHRLGVGDEVASMYHGMDQCEHASSATATAVDSLWLYLGTSDAAALTA